VGAYVKNSNPKIDLAIDKYEKITSFLRQRYDSLVDRSNSFTELHQLMK
jgi:flagellar biosynthesis/type III secretory pathway ATPase